MTDGEEEFKPIELLRTIDAVAVAELACKRRADSLTGRYLIELRRRRKARKSP